MELLFSFYFTFLIIEKTKTINELVKYCISKHCPAAVHTQYTQHVY